MAAPSVAKQSRVVPTAVSSDAALPVVSGQFGRRATITVPQSDPTGKFVVTPVTAGQGRAARTGDVAVVRYTAQVWGSGKALAPHTKKDAQNQIITVGGGLTLPALDRAVQNQPAGTRMLVVAPPAAAYGETGNKRLGVSGTDTVVFVVDIMQVISARATVHGEQRQAADSLPQVRMDRSGAAAISVPDSDAPRELAVERLVDGTGQVVKDSQTVVLQHSSAVWQNAQGEDRADLFMSSHADGRPLTVVAGGGNVLNAWDRALVGQRVGSRVLVVAPAKFAYGAHPPKGIPAGAVVVSVLDILAAA
ncbi:FKBP-type peptidyl-prolyl cis-trans isomerase [Streptomyces sp. NPDC058217]|uniref:FKBP-type peptidyl-prolyl cis-trans isomerase n=1 Tax=Streptomyces sp. NPDC058217 TaxID=3346384 RepID=UPI0036EC1BBA